MSPFLSTLAAGSSRGFGKNMGVKSFGRRYAESMTNYTGGTIYEVASPGNIDSYLDAATAEQDAILLVGPGTYNSNATDGDTYNSCPWRRKNVLIAGDTNDASTHIWTLNHSARRGKHLFTGGYSGTSNWKQAAFLHIKRPATSTTNYINAFAGQYNGYAINGGIVNCIFDSQGGGISWTYDNSNVGGNVKVNRCSFINYSAWYSSYSGTIGTNRVGNTLFGGARTSTFTDQGGNVEYATINSTTGDYSTATYPTAGHLYVPNTNYIY